MTKILIVDDEPLYRHGLFELLRRPNLKVDAAADGDEALRLFRRGGHQLVISDLSMPGLDGLGLMRAVKRESPSTRFVILSGVGTIQAALTAVRQGADDFLEKPVSREQINEVLTRVATPVAETGIVTANPTMLDRLERARRIAPTDATVLVQGESGTGKEMVARAIHGWSTRAAAPFVALNCAAMPDTLVEAELFGHERGAFTDARAPLGERPEDIVRLAEHSVRRFSADYGWSATTLTEAACDRLRTHSWPGNVRELENTLHRAVIEARGSDIDVAHLALDTAVLAPVSSGDLAGRSWDQVERELIMSTLARVNGNRKRAAQLMGMGERTLRNRLREYRLDGVAG